MSTMTAAEKHGVVSRRADGARPLQGTFHVTSTRSILRVVTRTERRSQGHVQPRPKWCACAIAPPFFGWMFCGVHTAWPRIRCGRSPVGPPVCNKLEPGAGAVAGVDTDPVLPRVTRRAWHVRDPPRPPVGQDGGAAGVPVPPPALTPQFEHNIGQQPAISLR